MPLAPPARPRSTLLGILVLWVIFYASFTLFAPPLLDDADSVHAEVAREMLLRHDYVTLYANGIRYLEKAPLLYWSMAACMRLSQLLGHTSARALAVAARIPLALTVLALALLAESFARRIYRSARAGLYAALILLSSPGLFLFTRILIPDALLCLFLTLALYAFYLTEEVDPQPSRDTNDGVPHPSQPHREGWVAFFFCDTNDWVPHPSQSCREGWDVRRPCYLFASACALAVLTKGLIGVIFPLAIVLLYLLLTRGPRGALIRIRQLNPLSSLAVFLLIAAPWHILIALANPTQGHPASFTFSHGHLSVPLPTQGNVHGWLWFYFLNEHLLRYLNLRLPRDYDTVPLWLFWSLCLIWLMPFSAFLFKALSPAARLVSATLKNLRIIFGSSSQLKEPAVNVAPAANVASEIGPGFSPDIEAPHDAGFSPRDTLSAVTTPTAPTVLPPNPVRFPTLLLALSALLPLLFFSLSTRQEYYVLPALPALAILIAGQLLQDDRANLRITAALLTLGALFAAASLLFLLHTPTPSTDLATLLQQNPSNYALSLGHLLDLNASALALFRLPLALAALGLFLGPFTSYLLRKNAHPHAATLALAPGAFTFLLASHLALQTFAPVLTSAQLARAIAPQLAPAPGRPPALLVIHQEYEFASTLGFYLRRPSYTIDNGRPIPTDPIHILTSPNYNGVPNYGRSSNLWYGSFFPDAPAIFETPQSLTARWPGAQRIFLWQDLANQPSPLPPLPGPIYVIAQSGGKAILSNQPNPTP
jgi:4-amino-4-deoxy-L-arabinose transferase-like glycosyltransferase